MNRKMIGPPHIKAAEKILARSAAYRRNQPKQGTAPTS
jgi:hypothetical protein